MDPPVDRGRGPLLPGGVGRHHVRVGNSRPPDAEQVDLFGDPVPPPADAPVRGRRGAVDLADWRTWLADPVVRQRYRARVCWRGTDRCAPWLGNLSSTGHGKVRVGSRGDGTRRMVSAHVLGYQLARGLITGDDDLCLAHSCDEPACQQPAHLSLVARAVNLDQYQARRWGGPLADVRGPRGRAVAVREAILSAREAGADVEEAIAAARAEGMPSAERLF